MPLGLILGLGRAMRRKRTSSLDILSSKRAPRDYYKGKNCKPTGFHTRKGGYVVVNEKLPNYVVPDLTDFKLKPYVSQCPREVKTAENTDTSAKIQRLNPLLPSLLRDERGSCLSALERWGMRVETNLSSTSASPRQTQPNVGFWANPSPT
ncbi:hypothetical protein NE237_025883 [Protea cynaroides]|uniref:Mitochondrial ribosomal protein L41 n=1 Tax=Protea cynaroides TaxID=273540 RepID=A0A9Q0K0Y2_9MAGN|nr:hypothetical protein NE237_025883 [Protea cynaroides]